MATRPERTTSVTPKGVREAMRRSISRGLDEISMTKPVVEARGGAGVELAGDLEDGVAVFGGRFDADQGEFAFDGVLGLEVFDLDDVDQFLKLLEALVEIAVVALDYESQAGEAGLLAVTRVERGKGEAASAEKRHEAVEGSRLVLDEGGDGVLMDARFEGVLERIGDHAGGAHLVASAIAFGRAGSMTRLSLVMPAATIG